MLIVKKEKVVEFTEFLKNKYEYFFNTDKYVSVASHEYRGVFIEFESMKNLKIDIIGEIMKDEEIDFVNKFYWEAISGGFLEWV